MALLHKDKTTTNNTLSWPEFMAEKAGNVIDPRLKQFYRAGCPDPNTPIDQAPLVALDLETTGLDSRRDVIVSVGVVPFTLTRIQSSKAKHWLVKPDKALTSTSVTFHRITHSDLEGAPTLNSLMDEILEALQGRLVVVHYHHIERNFLNAYARRILKEPLLFPVIDTMELEARLYRETRWAWLTRIFRRSETPIRLYESRLRYGLPPYNAHHALSDALATAELLQAEIAHHFSPETTVSELWC